MQPKDTAIRKRTQIGKTNRAMFIWIAAASAVVGFALVASIFLGQKLVFNEKVLAEKNRTVATLKANIEIIPELENQIRVLDTNEALSSVKAKDGDQAIQVILDALPAEANSLALGASLQDKLLAGIPGLTIDTLQVDPITGVESLSNGGVVQDTSTPATGSGEITFRFSVIGNQNALKKALVNIEKSIRAIEITSLEIESQGSAQVMTVYGKSFYEPAKEVGLQDKVVLP